MKKLSFGLMLISLFSFSALAKPYIELNYGYSNLSHDLIANYPEDNVRLVPSNSSDAYGITVGFQIDKTMGLEFSYSRSQHDSETSKLISSVGGVITKDDYDVTLKANTFSLGPVYRLQLAERLFAKGKIAATYTQYDVTTDKSRDVETLATDTEVNTLLSRKGYHKKKYGVLVGVGLDYRLFHNLYIGGFTSFKYDNNLDAIQLVGTLGYRF